jgi:aryl-alcohol dehydrogenase-like predicted oxidoreductase
MDINRSRRSFLAAGLGVPILGSASKSFTSSPEPPAASRPATPKLQYRTLGKTGLRVTTVGFGCMITSDPSVIERAADLGVLYFDTARTYQGGNNERMVGVALKKKRKDIVLSSKTKARTREEALQHIDKSLQELGTDYLDIWYLHDRSSSQEITDDLIEAQQTAKKAGKTRFAGVSTHSGQPELMPYLMKNPHIDVILTSFNFTMEPVMKTLIADAAAAAGKGIVAMKVMAGGFRRIQPSDPNYSKLKAEGGMLSALKWVVRDPNVHTTIPSITDMDQLDENLRAMAEPYGAPDEALLGAHLETIRPLYCRMCGKCDGQCRQGLPVADMLRYVTYADGYGQFALGREHFLELSAEHAAVDCRNCPGCTVECPHGVKVSQQLIRARELFAC